MPPPSRIEKLRNVIAYTPENSGIVKDAEGQKLSPVASILFNSEDATFAWKKKGMKVIKKDSICEKKFDFRSGNDIMFSESYSSLSDIELPMKD